ncbi:MAG: DNA primase TraC [Candidatus Accumulibacter phosphatis]|uniref:DNA primase TraC n=1 Tax=Candidatus Accumulibacter phosphatis TaxID=327160 RepID=A0A080M892_9PROT|nr:MAG: DNA primase TraC [Candidatus Accumulibacter phosphatis]
MNDIYQSITDKIIAELEAGGDDPFPRNALSQRPYRGINTIVLGLEAFCRGYTTHQWLTFRQALQLGGHVRKGERSSAIIYYELRQVEKADSEALAEGDDSEKRLLPLLKVFHVFNLDQVDGLPNEYRAAPDTGPAWEPSEIAERIIECSSAEIRHGGFRAFYSPPNDLIYLPLRCSTRTTSPVGWKSSSATSARCSPLPRKPRRQPTICLNTPG